MRRGLSGHPQERPHLCPFSPAAAEEENHLGWFCVEDDGNQIRKERHPLLLGHMPVTVAKQQEFKVGPGQPWVWPLVWRV